MASDRETHDGAPFVSTGTLPAPEVVQAWIDEAHERYRHIREGALVCGCGPVAGHLVGADGEDAAAGGQGAAHDLVGHAVPPTLHAEGL